MNTGEPYGIQCGVANADITLDHADSPDLVLERVNLLLAAHGLEFVSHETHADFGAYSLQKIA